MSHRPGRRLLHLMAPILGGLTGIAAGAGGASGPEASRLRQLFPDAPPVLACWFWDAETLQPDAYKPFLDMIARYGAPDILTTSLRAPVEVTDDAVREHVRQAVAYARERGMGIAMDLDPRLARQAFRQRYPDELQMRLRLRESTPTEDAERICTIPSEDLGDHQTFNGLPYISYPGDLVRVYAYERGAEGIEPETVSDVTDACTVTESAPERLSVALPDDAALEGRTFCVMAAFPLLTPDVFAPHLLEFQREIFEMYRDIDLAGVCKDEWGFPPCYDGCPAKNDFWFSRYRAEAYAACTGGRDLARDCLLMYAGERGRERERQAAINDFLRMSTERNAEIEQDCYDAAKEVFGPEAYVGTHPTWYPFPGLREFKKNGLSWWAARRDLAQTDEVTPYCVRTALAKKWDSGVFYNMFYDPTIEAYHRELWRCAITGGRVNYHPVWPSSEHWDVGRRAVLEADLMRGDCRVRLLNLVTDAPLDSPVAVVFGHACAMNWAGPSYDDTGVALADRFWAAGYAADLIPSSEIEGGALRIDDDGWVCYGRQRYTAVVVYHPQFEGEATARFVRGAADGGRTTVRVVGRWDRGPDATDLEVRGILGGAVGWDDSADAAFENATDVLRARGIEAVTPVDGEMSGFNRRSCAPATAGAFRLLDGTRGRVAGSDSPAGDPIEGELSFEAGVVAYRAEGLFAARYAADGSLCALAAGGLRECRGPGLDIRLEEPVDLALWRDPAGALRGVLQGFDGEVPPALLQLATNWARLALPEPLPVDAGAD